MRHAFVQHKQLQMDRNLSQAPRPWSGWMFAPHCTEPRAEDHGNVLVYMKRTRSRQCLLFETEYKQQLMPILCKQFLLRR